MTDKQKTQNWQDIKVCHLEEKDSEKISNFLLILHRLELATMALAKALQSLQSGSKSEENQVLENVLLDYALIHYASCFKGKGALKATVFSALPKESQEGAKNLHAMLMKIHTRLVERDGSEGPFVKVGLSLSEDKEEGVQDIFWAMSRFTSYEPDMVKAFGQLVVSVKAEVKEKSDKERVKLLKKAQSEDAKDLYKRAVAGAEFAREETPKPAKKSTKKSVTKKGK